MKIKYNIYATHSKEYPWKAIYLFNVSIEIYNGHDFASTENKFVVMIRMWGEKWVGEAKNTIYVYIGNQNYDFIWLSATLPTKTSR